MLPFGNQRTNNKIPPGQRSQFQSNRNLMKFNDVSSNLEASSENLRMGQNYKRKFSSVASSQSTQYPGMMNISSFQQVDPYRMPGHISQTESVPPEQPKSNYTAHWQNQPMSFGVMSVPEDTIPSTSFQQGKTIKFMHDKREVGFVEKCGYQYNKVANQELMMAPPESSQKKNNFTFTLPSTSASQSTDKSNIKKDMKGEKQSKSRHLVGSVEQTIRWYPLTKANNIYAVFEVHGVLESVYSKTDSLTIIMIKQGMNGPSIQGIFCSIDRPFMNNKLRVGDNIVCVGKMKGARKMQVFNAWQDNARLDDYKRISFLSQRALQETVSSNSEL